MTTESPVRWTDPERQRLEERVAATEIAWLTLDVDVETLRVEIDNFALIHHQRLGPLYARLDELDALVAEAVAARTGDPEDVRRAAEARRVVDELPDLDTLFDSVRQAQEAAASTPEPEEPVRRVRPGKDAQRLYRELARRAHPDLSTDPAEQQRRSAFIARVNEAYARGAAEELQALDEEWSTAPETAPDPQAPDRGDWLRQRLEWLTGRIGELATEQVRLEGTAMGSLLRLSPQDPDQLLEELAEQLLARAADRRVELERLLGSYPARPRRASADNGRTPSSSQTPSPTASQTASPTASQTQESPPMSVQIPTAPAAAVPADAVLLDVREQDEWDAGHVEGALHIPIGEFVGRIAEVPDAPLYVLCRVGGRSAQVVQYLVGQGREAVNVDGGMFAWEEAGRPMVSSSGADAYVL